ncbi:MAG: copper amine oxidase N-terminal domain-containing protein [Paenibacillaceae bacterium]
MNKRLKIIVSGLLCLLLVGLAGCTVAGTKLDDALNNAVKMKSYEGDGSLSLEFTDDGVAKPMKLGNVAFSSLGKINLMITSMKQAEPNTLSLAGNISMMNRTIPFSLQLNKAQLVILIDNNPHPIVFELDKLIGGSIKLDGIDISPIFSDPNKLLSMLSPFVISKLPDLQNLSVSSVNEKINNENVDLQKLHTELNSADAIAFVKSLLSKILADPPGIKALVSQLYNAFFEPTEVKEGGFDINALFINGASNKLVELLQNLSTSLDDATATEGGLSSFLNDKTSIKTDLYLDGSTQLRKIGLDLNLGGIIKASGSFSLWKINQTVTADPAVNVSKDASQWAHLLKSMNSNSDAYQLLMNDLHVLNKEIKMIVPPFDKSGKVAVGSAYISKTNRTMVPVRYISETLDSEVGWDAVKKQVTITDIMTGKTIVLTLNSTKATIDGKPATLDSPAVSVNDSTYVPVGFIAEALTGAKPDWDQASRTVSISKK